MNNTLQSLCCLIGIRGEDWLPFNFHQDYWDIVLNWTLDRPWWWLYRQGET